MLLLHTSDWHLGRSFHGVDLLAEQARVLDHLVEVVHAESVDVVLVSGDVYDRALPPVDAVALCGDALGRLVGAGAQVVVISGNHDSATRLGWGAGVLAAGGLHVRTDPARAGVPVVVGDAHGPVAVYGLPYLEPATAAGALGDPGLRGHDGVTRAAIARVRADLAGRRGVRSVVLAHAFLTGAATSDSERDITVGGVAGVPVGLFDGFDYAALGHLHGAQTLRPAVRYSGSPLAYSFSEAGHRKASWLVELGPGGLVGVEPVEVPGARPLSLLSGRLDDLLRDATHGPREGHYLSVTLTDAVRPLDAMTRLQARFPHAVRLEHRPQGAAGDGETSYTARLRGRDDLAVAGEFVGHVRGSAASNGERALLAEAFAAVRTAGAAA